MRKGKMRFTDQACLDRGYGKGDFPKGGSLPVQDKFNPYVKNLYVPHICTTLIEHSKTENNVDRFELLSLLLKSIPGKVAFANIFY